jgi:hypothetical protein
MRFAVSELSLKIESGHKNDTNKATSEKEENESQELQGAQDITQEKSFWDTAVIS